MYSGPRNGCLYSPKIRLWVRGEFQDPLTLQTGTAALCLGCVSSLTVLGTSTDQQGITCLLPMASDDI